jgi:BlaI family penicillinase repressor
MAAPVRSREMPAPLELQCLKVLWICGEGTVSDVQRALEPRRKLAYTTVMTLLDRLLRKGAVSRRKSGRAFVYSPAVTRESLRTIAVRDLLDNFFDSSEAALIKYLENRGGPIPTMADVLYD